MALSLGVGLVLALSGCGGDTCESVRNEMEEIGRGIQKDPSKAMQDDTQKKLAALGEKLEEMGCVQ